MSDSDSSSESSLNSSLDSDVGEDEEAAIPEEEGVGEDSDLTDDIDDPIVVDEDHGNDTDETAATTNTAQTKVSDTNNNWPSWNGERLFPPPRKVLNPSKAWKFGGFKKANGKLDMSNTVCGICGKIFKYRSTPAHLSQHLQSEHLTIYTSTEVSSKAQPKMHDFFVQKGASSKYKGDHPKQKELSSKLVEWIVDSNRPFSIVDDKKLKEAFEIADPRFKVPSPYKIKSEISKLYVKKKEELLDEFSSIEYFSCTNDAGSSFGGKSFVDINVHYLDENFYPKKKILDVLEMKENKTADNYKERVVQTLCEFNIEKKVFSYTTDNENTMRKAFSKDERNGCFSHIQSLSSKKALDSQKPLTILRSKLRKVSKKANKSSKLKYALQKQQKLRGLKMKTLKQEVKTRFTATHTMIRSFMNDPKETSGDGFDDDKINENIEAINSAMKACKFKKKMLSQLEIKSDDVKKMKELVSVLDIMEEGVTLIGGEKYATASAVLPFLHRLYKILEEDETDPVYMSNFKTYLREDLAGRCDNNLNKEVLTKASFFDKRFAMLKFLDKEETLDRENILREIKSELMVIEHKLTVKEGGSVQEFAEEPAKKKRFLGFGLSDVDDEESVDKKYDAIKELESYIKEPKLRSDNDPFLWWRTRKELYPCMFQLARKYLCVQGTSTPAERVISRLGEVLSKKRLAMLGELFSKTMFLTDCM